MISSTAKKRGIHRKKEVFREKLNRIQINKHPLSRIHQLFYEEQHNREDAIIRNIYNYSGKIAYNQALLLIGLGHRKTIFEKMENYQSENHVKLNCALYGN